MSGITFGVYENFKRIEYKLSGTFIGKLEEKYNLIVIEKMGEGGNNLVLKARDKTNKEYALIVSKNSGCKTEILVNKHYQMVLDLQKKGILNTDYIVQIYDPIILEDIKLSDNSKYCSNISSVNVYIEVEDLLKMTLNEKVFYLSKNATIDERIDFLYKLRDRVYDMFDFISSKGVEYTDLATNNLAFLDDNDMNTLVFIDVDSFKRKGEIELEEEEEEEQLEQKEEEELEQKEEEQTEEQKDFIMEEIQRWLFRQMLIPMSEEEEEYEEPDKNKIHHLFTKRETGEAMAKLLMYPK
jgi:hypothetical protein